MYGHRDDPPAHARTGRATQAAHRRRGLRVAGGFVDASLSAAYTETEAFAEAAREKLAASQRAVDEGRVASVPYGQLARFIAERNKQAHL